MIGGNFEVVASRETLHFHLIDLIRCRFF